MTRGQFAVTLIVVAVAGLLGGALSDWIRAAPAHAQQEEKRLVVDELVAKKVTVAGPEGVCEARDGRLALIDGEGQERAVLALRAERLPGPYLDFRTAAGKPRLKLGLGTNEIPYVRLSAPTGYPLSSWAISENGSIGLNLPYDNGMECIKIAQRKGRGPRVYLRDNTGKVRVFIGTDDQRTWQIRILDANGNIVWTAP